MISRDSIEEVKSKLDIVDVISDFVTLKKSGANYKALSPFSNEKTASFFVVPAKGIFKDFSSGKGGDAISFVMEHEKLDYAEAIRYLAKKYGVDLKETKLSDASQAAQSEREGLYVLMNYAREYYKEKLLSSEEGRSIGLSYFKERGINERDIQKFDLGYAPDGWENFSKDAIRAGYNKELLEKTGLIVKKEDGSTYDRFRGRVIFPVHNLTGKVIAFGARMLGKDKNQPKYINSPETEIYHKSDVLYGMFQGKNAIRQKDNCFLVEGYTDVISMHQCDVENVVASSGTALTESQIKLIRRFTENITVVFDGDAAGIKAALRGIDMILQGGLNVRVVLIPDGDDPDSFSKKKGTTGFQKFLAENTKDFVSFKAGLYAQEAGGDPIRKAESIKEIVHSIGMIPDPVKRSVYIQETSKLLAIGESVLFSELNKILIAERTKRQKERVAFPESELVAVEPEQPKETLDHSRIVQLQEKETIRLLLNYADRKLLDQVMGVFLVNELEDVTFSNPVYKEIFDQFVDSTKNDEIITSDYLISNGSETIKSVVAELVVRKRRISPHWASKYKIYIPDEEDDLEKNARENINLLKYRLILSWIQTNKEMLKTTRDPIEVDTILIKLEELNQAEKAVASELTIASGVY
jgi:DNA primase